MTGPSTTATHCPHCAVSVGRVDQHWVNGEWRCNITCPLCGTRVCDTSLTEHLDSQCPVRAAESCDDETPPPDSEETW